MIDAALYNYIQTLFEIVFAIWLFEIVSAIWPFEIIHTLDLRLATLGSLLCSGRKRKGSLSLAQARKKC